MATTKKSSFGFSDYLLLGNPFTFVFGASRVIPKVIASTPNPFKGITNTFSDATDKAVTKAKRAAISFSVVLLILVVVAAFAFFFLKGFGGKLGTDIGGNLA